MRARSCEVVVSCSTLALLKRSVMRARLASASSRSASSLANWLEFSETMRCSECKSQRRLRRKTPRRLTLFSSMASSARLFCFCTSACNFVFSFSASCTSFCSFD